MSLLPPNVPLETAELERLEELMVTEATQGLGVVERSELDLLLERAKQVEPSSESNADSSVGSVSASVDLLEPIYEAAAIAELSLLHEALERQGERGTEEMPAFVEAELRKLAAEEAKRTRRGEVLPFERARVTNYGLSPAWWLAAAALFLALLGWWPRLSFGPNADAPIAVATQNPSGVSENGANPTVLDGEPDTLILAFQATEDAAGASASGALLWNPVLQQGEMRIANLEANDPTVFQYQLWIFDAERDERHPVDGGVFDVPASGIARIPINARVPVGTASLFAITIEPPGGVVVSKRERIVLLARSS